MLESLARELGFHLAHSRQLGVDVSGDGYVSGHEVTLRADDGSQQAHVVYVETHRHVADRDGVLTMRDERTGDEIAVWLYPRDPALPGLPTAVFPDAATLLLRRIGVEVDAVSLTLVAYRPGKRAVVCAQWPGAAVYLKVVPPSQVADLHARYATWRRAGLPVPETLGWSDSGIVAFASLGGRMASAAIADLATDDGDALLVNIEQLCEQIAEVTPTSRRAPPCLHRLRWYEERLKGMLGESNAHVRQVETLDATCRGIEATLAAAPAATSVTIHGDLHLGQLFIDPTDRSRISGVLDIDTAGRGDPADDAAALHAHLIVSSLMHQQRGDAAVATQCDALATRWRERWTVRPERGFEARAHAISATHLIAHALGQSVPPGVLVHRAHELIGILRGRAGAAPAVPQE